MKPSAVIPLLGVLLLVQLLVRSGLQSEVDALAKKLDDSNKAHAESLKDKDLYLRQLADRATAAEAGIKAVQDASKWNLTGTYRRIPLGSTGAEVCAEHGETCLGLRSSPTSSAATKEFWGYSQGTCSSRVKVLQNCTPGLDFTLDKTEFRKSPLSKVQGEAGGGLCLGRPFYDFAVCMSTPDDSRVKVGD